jgi:hypothetical protein
VIVLTKKNRRARESYNHGLRRLMSYYNAKFIEDRKGKP